MGSRYMIVTPCLRNPIPDKPRCNYMFPDDQRMEKWGCCQADLAGSRLPHNGEAVVPVAAQDVA